MVAYGGIWWYTSMVAWDIWIYFCLREPFSIFLVMAGSSQKPSVDVSGMEEKTAQDFCKFSWIHKFWETNRDPLNKYPDLLNYKGPKKI